MSPVAGGITRPDTRLYRTQTYMYPNFNVRYSMYPMYFILLSFTASLVFTAFLLPVPGEKGGLWTLSYCDNNELLFT